MITRVLFEFTFTSFFLYNFKFYAPGSISSVCLCIASVNTDPCACFELIFHSLGVQDGTDLA